VFLFFIITISSKLIIYIFTTEEFYEAWKYIPILTLGVILSSISGFAGSTFSASRESKYFFYSSIWGAVSSLLFNFILIPLFGIMGAALSVVISFAVMAVSRIVYSWKYVKIRNIRIYILILLVCILTVFVMVYVQVALLKYSFIACLFILFVCINLGLKEDFLKLYQGIKQKL
jgi:O-antigen/teichoic acid export membrane protein